MILEMSLDCHGQQYDLEKGSVSTPDRLTFIPKVKHPSQRIPVPPTGL